MVICLLVGNRDTEYWKLQAWEGEAGGMTPSFCSSLWVSAEVTWPHLCRSFLHPSPLSELISFYSLPGPLGLSFLSPPQTYSFPPQGLCAHCFFCPQRLSSALQGPQACPTALSSEEGLPDALNPQQPPQSHLPILIPCIIGKTAEFFLIYLGIRFVL